MSVLRLQNVSSQYGAVRVLRDVDLDIDEGERHILIGPNGAGKTTLLNVIAGVVRASSGTLKVFGRDVTGMAPHMRARAGLSRTFQRSEVFDDLTVVDNLRLAVSTAKSKRYSLARPWGNGEAVAETMKRFGLADKSGQLVGTLSHGDRRQLEIGMAILSGGNILLFDEPAAGLSPADRPRLIALLSNLSRDKTLLMIEHDMTVAMAVADRITVLTNGAVFRSGTPREISTDSEVKRVYLGGGGP